MAGPWQGPSQSRLGRHAVRGARRRQERREADLRLNDSERGTIRIKVTGNTRFERIAGFGGLRVGMTGVEATVRRSNGRWVAIEVERYGGGGRHGGDD